MTPGPIRVEQHVDAYTEAITVELYIDPRPLALRLAQHAQTWRHLVPLAASGNPAALSQFAGEMAPLLVVTLDRDQAEAIGREIRENADPKDTP